MGHPSIKKITFTPDVSTEAIMQAEFVHGLTRLRDQAKELQDADYLYNPLLSLEETQRITSHLRDIVRSVEAAAKYVPTRSN